MYSAPGERADNTTITTTNYEMISHRDAKWMMTLGVDSIEKFWLEFRLEKRIEIPFSF